MRCPSCGHPDLRVVTGNHGPAWRLRQRCCSACGRKVKTIELPADGLIAFRAPADRPRASGSRLAVAAARVSFVRHLLQQLQDPPAQLP
ncbi:hypothetical protein KBY96_14135 [Cyanobium sp. ATX 6A2]|uniref:hypothetical protein n=1 Tax=Cyanobium sp. ATX 6A2 TaxID=2823700 RepID=UPI0020CC7B85|nr:hypothetical protein [Cyanobium sp. ATX 6A2]MCP9889062.1 hypothetical protein [Cyanobium sp. ATX 6A2]